MDETRDEAVDKPRPRLSSIAERKSLQMGHTESGKSGKSLLEVVQHLSSLSQKRDSKPKESKDIDDDYYAGLELLDRFLSTDEGEEPLHVLSSRGLPLDGLPLTKSIIKRPSISTQQPGIRFSDKIIELDNVVHPEKSASDNLKPKSANTAQEPTTGSVDRLVEEPSDIVETDKILTATEKSNHVLKMLAKSDVGLMVTRKIYSNDIVVPDFRDLQNVSEPKLKYSSGSTDKTDTSSSSSDPSSVVLLSDSYILESESETEADDDGDDDYDDDYNVDDKEYNMQDNDDDKKLREPKNIRSPQDYDTDTIGSHSIGSQIGNQSSGNIKSSSRISAPSGGSVQIRKTLQFVPDPDYNSTIPFILTRAYGINPKAKFLNMTTTMQHPLIFYAASHVGVFMNYKTREQSFVLGHKNQIVNISSDVDCRWIVTADSGKENSLIVWDTENTPIYTLFDPHGEYNVGKLCLSHDAKYLVTVGDEPQHIIKFWAWTYCGDYPNSVHTIKENVGKIMEISNNMNRTNQFMITFEQKIVFIDWDDGKLNVTIPDVKCKKSVGKFTSSTYLFRSNSCASSTDSGFIILWGGKIYSSHFEPKHCKNKKMFLRAIKVQCVPITTITSINRLFVTGDVNGHIKFYDCKLRILYWMTQLNFGPIEKIDFHRFMRKYSYTDVDHITQTKMKKCLRQSPIFEDRSQEYNKKIEELIPQDATLNKTPFIIRDLMVLTKDAELSYIHFLTHKKEIIIKKTETHVTSVDMQRESPIICFGFSNGKLTTHNYVEKNWNVETYLPSSKEDEDNNRVTCIKYSYKDTQLNIGTSNGSFWSLHPTTLEFLTKDPLKYDSEPIIGIKYSISNDKCAYWDASSAIFICIFDYDEPISLKFKASIRAHYKTIVDIIFIPLGYKKDRMISIGKDRNLVEYDIQNINDGVVNVLLTTAIEQTAVPNCVLYYTTNEQSGEFLISENKYKFKILSDKDFKVQKTILGPVFDMPIQNMKMISFGPMRYSEYMVFHTEKHIGIHHMPPDGNPFKYVAMIGHPTNLLNFVLSYDRTQLVTIGSDDNCSLLWKIKADAASNMEARGSKGTDPLDPFYTLIEGGHDGWLSKEMIAMFYYMQILHQDDDASEARRITNKIDLQELPFLMRGLGFYPTEYELQNLMREARASNYNEQTKGYEITFEDFIKLYLNHRPAFGIKMEDIRNAFKKLDCQQMKKKDFFNLLCEYGETFTNESLYNCMSILTQPNSTERNMFVDNIPEVITEEILLKDILGIDFDKSLYEIERSLLSIDSTNM